MLTLILLCLVALLATNTGTVSAQRTPSELQVVGLFSPGTTHKGQVTLFVPRTREIWHYETYRDGSWGPVLRLRVVEPGQPLQELPARQE